MTDQIIDDVSSPLDGNWYDGIAGEGDAHTEMLKGYDSSDAFISEFNEMKGRDWRTEMAGDDAKFKGQLERYATPRDFGTSWREQNAKISAGIKPGELAENATEDDIKAFRESNGIPAEAAGYYETLPDGLVLGEDDKPMADVFMDALHSTNASPAVAHALISKYNDAMEQSQEAQVELDIEQSKAATDELRNIWQNDYRTNINAVQKFLSRELGEEGKKDLLNGRFEDGRGFMNNTKLLEMFARVERQIDPLVALNRPAGENAEQSMTAEIAEIEKFMKDHRAAYNVDEPKQARLRQLYDLRMKNSA
jgi:hypothetical protein